MRVVKTWNPKDSDMLRVTTQLVAQCGKFEEKELLFKRNQELSSKITKLSETYKSLSARFGMIQREMQQISDELAATHREKARIDIIMAAKT